VTLRIVTIPALSDNYAYLVVDDGSRSAIVVDPSEAEPVEASIAREGVRLAAIWCTHHHWDHVGGVASLVAAHGPFDVVGGAYDSEHARIEEQTRAVREGETLAFAGAQIDILEIPGHTLGAIAYVVREPGESTPLVFTGDMLFLAGCGRVFEGTMEMMRASLDKLRKLPPQSRVYCGHEYTEKNIAFARTIEPENAELVSRAERVAAARRRGEPSVPAPMIEELATNPFLRWDEPAVIAAAARLAGRAPDAMTGVDVFGALRAAKDRF